MTDKIFIDWIKLRLTPVSNEMFSEDENIILVLENAKFHHAYDEVKVFESNSKA